MKVPNDGSNALPPLLRPWIRLLAIGVLGGCAAPDGEGLPTGDDTTPAGVDDDATGDGDDASPDDDTTTGDDDTSLADDTTADDDSVGDDDTYWEGIPHGNMLLVVAVGDTSFEFTDEGDEASIHIWNATPAPGDTCMPGWAVFAARESGDWFSWMVTFTFPTFPSEGATTDLSVLIESNDAHPGDNHDLALIYEDEAAGLYYAVSAGTASVTAADTDGLAVTIADAHLCKSASPRYEDLEESTDCEDVASIDVHLVPKHMWPEDFVYLLDYFATRDPYPSSEDSWGDGWCTSEYFPMGW